MSSEKVEKALDWIADYVWKYTRIANAILKIAVIAAAGYVAGHFIQKYW